MWMVSLWIHLNLQIRLLFSGAVPVFRPVASRALLFAHATPFYEYVCSLVLRPVILPTPLYNIRIYTAKKQPSQSPRFYAIFTPRLHSDFVF